VRRDLMLRFGLCFPKASYVLTNEHLQQIDATHWILDLRTLVGPEFYKVRDVCLFLANAEGIDRMPPPTQPRPRAPNPNIGIRRADSVAQGGAQAPRMGRVSYGKLIPYIRSHTKALTPTLPPLHGEHPPSVLGPKSSSHSRLSLELTSQRSRVCGGGVVGGVCSQPWTPPARCRCSCKPVARSGSTEAACAIRGPRRCFRCRCARP
jgi:hypothetical protein